MPRIKINPKQYIGDIDGEKIFHDLQFLDSNQDLLSNYFLPMEEPTENIKMDDSLNVAIGKLEYASLQVRNAAKTDDTNIFEKRQSFNAGAYVKSLDSSELLTEKIKYAYGTLNAANNYTITSDSFAEQFLDMRTISDSTVTINIDERSFVSFDRMMSIDVTIFTAAPKSFSFAFLHRDNSMTMHIDPNIPSGFAGDKIVTMVVRIWNGHVVIYASKVL